MLKKILIAIVMTTLPLAAVTTTHAATEPAKAEKQSPEVKKALKKLMEDYGQGRMSAKTYKERKEELLKGATQEAKSEK